MGAVVGGAGEEGAGLRNLPGVEEVPRLDPHQALERLRDSVASATTRRPRVASTFICECFLSVSVLPDRR